MTRPFPRWALGLLALLMALLGWQAVVLLGGGGLGVLIGVAIVAAAALAPALVFAVQHLSPWVWVALGSGLWMVLALPGLSSYFTGDHQAQSAAGPLPGFAWWIVPAALMTASMLLQISLRQRVEPRATVAARPYRAWLSGGLSGLLLIWALHFLYWLLVWDRTYDPLNWLWLILPMLAVLASGAVLIATLPDQRLIATACAVGIPALVMTVYLMAQRVDYRLLTDQRAAQAVQAIEAFRAREGRYPATLREARPWYELPLAQPVIIYGQDWCYLAGPDSYQLGFIDREHWSSPDLIGRLVSSAGTPAGTGSICAAEIAALEE